MPETWGLCEPCDRWYYVTAPDERCPVCRSNAAVISRRPRPRDAAR